ncbi:hypothetical protein P5V15_011339 [Pogonomyrmex californicus]
MVRSSKSVKRTSVKTGMSAQGDNVMIGSSPYYFRHVAGRESAMSQDDGDISRQNGNCKYCVYSLATILAILFCLVIAGLLFPYPLHASCIVKWKFDDSCSYVMQKFQRQIMNWSSWKACQQRGSSCLYTLQLPVENNIIRATHRTPNLKSLEKIEIIFKELNNTCLVTADSVSNEWFMLFDSGTNYCNLHNLVVGAGLDIHTKFLELTSDAVCTQFNMAVC